MSEQMPSAQRGPTRNRLRAGLQKLNFAREQRVLGPAEIIALAGSLLVLLLVVVGYLYFLMPARSRLDALQSQRSLLNIELQTYRDSVVKGESTKVAVEKITASLDLFENQGLLEADSGRLGLYESLNKIIRTNGLRNSSGPTYTPLDAATAKAGATRSKSTNTKWQSIFPGLTISVTVEGQYQNLRHFIRDLETNKQLVIINSVELERSTETNNLPSAEGEQPGGSRAAQVTLRLDMSTYFQRRSDESSGTNEPAR